MKDGVCGRRLLQTSSKKRVMNSKLINPLSSTSSDRVVLSLEWNSHEIRQGKTKPSVPVKQEVMNAYAYAFRFLEQHSK